MRTRRSLKLVLAVVAAVLAAGTTFAWAGVLVGGHRADHIGTFEPVARHLVPATAPVTPGTATGGRPDATSTSGTAYATTSPGAGSDRTTAAPPTTSRQPDDSKTPTTGDNGRHNDD